jgi:hypothetical protein
LRTFGVVAAEAGIFPKGASPRGGNGALGSPLDR